MLQHCVFVSLRADIDIVAGLEVSGISAYGSKWLCHGNSGKPAKSKQSQFQAATIWCHSAIALARIIPTVIDQNPCAHLRMPRDMIFHGWSMRLFQAWQHSATMSS